MVESACQEVVSSVESSSGEAGFTLEGK